MPDTESQSTPRATRSLVLLAIYAALAGWLFYLDATSWPHEGSWTLLAYVFLLSSILFQCVSLACAKLTGRALTRRVLARVVTIPAGVVLAAALQAGAGALSMGAFEQAYAPFVEQVGAGLADACGSGAKYFAIPAVAEFNRRTGRLPAARLHQDGKRFVLGFAGGSIDIDGSTLYYDSGAGIWRRYHNDNQDARAAHQQLVAGLAECKLRAEPVRQ